ncbi:MAG: hypothetical protein NZ703_01865 [Gemmataceae bacterium]|nr:hypothetical protein [Gemmataceae bacterium]MCS7269805.1 hypothetical protein [Gemmataceae bacterium]MDW8243127.1 hypothetical protein [Thermogemmata sp.]
MNGLLTGRGSAAARLLTGMLAVTVMAISGCASARYVERHADSGVVAIPENSNHWPTYYRQAALDLIEKHVGPHYEIIEEREVVVGQQTSNNQQVGPDFLAGFSTTRDLTEWRIAYRRAAAPSVLPLTGSRGPLGGGGTPGGSSPASGGVPATGSAGPAAGTNGVQPAGGVPGVSTTGSAGVIPSVAPPPMTNRSGTTIR